MSKGGSFLDEEFPNGVQGLGDGRAMENAAGVIFLLGGGIWQGVILTIPTFLKA